MEPLSEHAYALLEVSTKNECVLRKLKNSTKNSGELSVRLDEKVRKASDPCGERPFEPFLIVPSEMGHPSSELKCLVG